jgi:hypothetical protein
LSDERLRALVVVLHPGSAPLCGALIERSSNF